MLANDQVRAWKDPQYRSGLTKAELAALNSPVPSVELNDPVLARMAGGPKETEDFTFTTCAPSHLCSCF